jgi:hypothetical protein
MELPITLRFAEEVKNEIASFIPPMMELRILRTVEQTEMDKFNA